MKRILSLLLCAVMLVCALPAALAADIVFEDVPEGTYYTEAVKYTYEAGLFKGLTETTFGPFVEISRAMFVTVLGRFTGVEEDREAETEFTDTRAGSYYIGYVKWAYDNGIVNGIGNGLFAPDASITRQDMCVILRRYCNYMGIELTESVDEISFTDEADISGYAKEAVKALQRAGIVNGVGSAFDPKGTSNRAQAATVLMRLAMLAESQKDAMRLTNSTTGVSVEYTVGCGITATTTLDVTLDTHSYSSELADPKTYTVSFSDGDKAVALTAPVTVKLPVGEGENARERSVYLLDGNELTRVECKVENGYYVLETDCTKTIVTGVLAWTENY